MADTSTKPYMIRALHEWCTDNGYTPQIVVQVDANTMVPPHHIRDGQITLNIGALATNRLVIGNEAIEFQARFNGVTENLYVPVGAVIAIFARETGAGMSFEVEETSSAHWDEQYQAESLKAVETTDSSRQASETGLTDTKSPSEPDPKRPKLTIVK
jgi:stringent starvation protein B